MVLPKYFDKENNKEIGEMIIKRIRLKSSTKNLKEYKKIRILDHKINFEHKHDFYFEKAKDSNYEALIYGEIVADRNRDSLIINNYHIVKGYFKDEKQSPLLKLHKNDLVLIFDKNPFEEIDWHSTIDIQNRLFRTVKFIENKEKGVLKEIIFARHNYALGDVDNVPKEKRIESKKEGEQLTDLKRIVIGRSPSTLNVVPAKLDALGKLDIDYSMSFLESNSI
jgi:hypothetical protein